MKSLCHLLCGVIFGLGLLISGMANPAKVQNFLDLAGDWDPSLAFVMGGAIAVAMPGFMLLSRVRDKPLYADAFQFPSLTQIDKPLILGAALFGIGWGLGGFCPGPAISSLSLGASGTYFFVAAMLIGMCAARYYRRALDGQIAS